MKKLLTINKKSAGQKLLWLSLAALICLISILAWTPPVDRGALTHQLAVPKLYLKHGGITEIPSIIFSYYPMNLELLYIIPLYFGSDIIPKFIHLAFGLLTALLIYRYLSARLTKIYALIGVLMFLSLPVVIKLSITVYVDLGLIFFSTASLLYCLKWIEQGYKPKLLIISAIFGGLALGTKYNGLVIFCILALFVPFLYVRTAVSTEISAGSDHLKHKSRSSIIQLKALIYGAVFVVIALAVFSPWMIRNYIWTGNPVYPLYNSIFKSKAVSAEIVEENAESPRKTPWVHFATRKYIFQESNLDIALIPVRVFFQGQDNNPKYFDGALNPYLFFLPLLFLLIPGETRGTVRVELKTMGVFAILVLIIGFMSVDMRVRYISPMIPPLVILSVFGLRNLWEISANNTKLQTACRIVAVLFLVFCWGKNLLYLHQQFEIVDPFGYISGKIDRDTYIENHRPEYAAFRYANQHLPESSLMLTVFFGNRRYYSDRDLICDDRILFELGKQQESAMLMTEELKRRQFTHLLIYLPMLEKTVNDSFNLSQKELFTDFFQHHARLLFHKNSYALFELVLAEPVL